MATTHTIQIYDQYETIDPQAWDRLVQESDTATWFQTREAYRFYTSLPQEMTPFVYAVAEQPRRTTPEGSSLPSAIHKEAACTHSLRLTGVVVGYITQTRSKVKQFFTRRAIIIGGAMLAEAITNEALTALLTAVRQGLQRKAIYIELRNFHDYSRWRSVFEANGFTYQPHLNFHIDTSSLAVVEQNLGKSRKRDIRTSIRDGITPVQEPTLEQVREYYTLLETLYRTKVKTPLFSWAFFEQLYQTEGGRFLLCTYEGRIIGGTVCVCLPGKGVYEWFVCGEDGKYEHIFPSSYATYLGICHAAEGDYPLFDMMGAGKPDEAYGVRDFKARFGGKEVEHGRYLCVCHPLLYRLGTLGVKILKKR